MKLCTGVILSDAYESESEILFCSVGIKKTENLVS